MLSSEELLRQFLASQEEKEKQNQLQIQLMMQQMQLLQQQLQNSTPTISSSNVVEPTYDPDALWNEDYHWYDFLNEFVKIDNLTFSQKKVKNELIPALLKIIRMIELGRKRFVVLKTGFADKDHPLEDYIQIMEYNKFHSEYPLLSGFYYQIPIESSKGNTLTKEKFWTFHLVTKMQIFAYRQMDWVPFNPEEPLVLHKDIFNTFTGFTAKPIDEPDMELIRPILNHIKICWVKGVEKDYTWILDWLASLIQDPRRHLPCVVLVGPQGAGKTMPVEFVLKRVFGHHCTATANNLDDVVTRFNNILANKFLVYIAETEGTTTRDGSLWTKMNTLKSFITDDRILLEQKNVAKYQASNHLHWIMSTNSLESLRLESGDRRFQIFEVSDEFLGNTQYFNDLAATLTNEAAIHFYSFLLQRGITTDLKVYDTEAKTELKAMSLPNPVRFWNSLSDRSWKPSTLKFKLNLVDAKGDDIPIIGISKKQLFEVYKQWCLETVEHSTTDNWFYRHLKTHGYNTKEQSGYLYYPKSDMEEIFKDLIKASENRMQTLLSF